MDSKWTGWTNAEGNGVGLISNLDTIYRQNCKAYDTDLIRTQILFKECVNNKDFEQFGF